MVAGTRWAGVAAALASSLAMAGPPSAVQAAPASRIVVSDAWSRPTPAGLPTAVAYMTLTNLGATPDRLLRGETPIAAGMELHRSTMSGGVMSMQAVTGGLEIPAHGEARLTPGGYHLMLVGLKRGLKLGESFPATLVFARAGRVRVRIAVRLGGGMGPAMAGMK